MRNCTTKLGEQFGKIFAQVDERSNWAYQQLLEVRNRISYFSEEEINKRLYEYAADMDYHTYVYEYVYVPVERNPVKQKRTPEEYILRLFYCFTVKRLVEESIFEEKCKYETLYIVYDGKKNCLRIEDKDYVILASVGCNELTKKIFKCLEEGYANLSMTVKAYSRKEVYGITEKITEDFLKGNPSNESIFEYFCKAIKFAGSGSKISKETLAKVFHHISVDSEETMQRCEEILKRYDRFYRFWHNREEYDCEARNAVAEYEMNMSEEEANKAFIDTHVTSDYFCGICSPEYYLGESEKYYFRLAISPIEKQEENKPICQEALAKLAKVSDLMEIEFVNTI